MAMQPQIWHDFLADLDIVCPKAHDFKLPLTFLNDLEGIYADARAHSRQERIIVVTDLKSLAQELETWRSYYQQRLREYLDRLPSDDPLYEQVSLFGTMDYGRLETAHTRALAWLLGKREHGFGFKLLEALLQYLLNGRRIRLTGVDKVESEHPLYGGPASGNAGRIDIFAEGQWEEQGGAVSWRLVIEAKIDAEESDEQLSRYDDRLQQWYPQRTKELRVFLTPEGQKPQTGSANWRAMSFRDLASVFRRVSGLQNCPGYHFLRYYLTGVLRDVCGMPVPISSDCPDPYKAVDYLQSVLGTRVSEDAHGQSR